MDAAYLEFEAGVLRPALADADRLASSAQGEADARAKRVAAAEVLDKARAAALAGAARDGLSAAAAGAFAAAAAVLRARWGLLLLETDRAGEAEAALADAVPALAGNAFQHVTLLQNVFNALGLLWSRRQQPRRSLELLQQGEELYKAWIAAAGAGEAAESSLQALSLQEQGPASASSSSGAGQAEPAVPERARRLAKDKYAHTLFYLAQVYGQLDEREQSSRCCAETLSCQLELGVRDWPEWAENCGQLAALHTAAGEVSLAHYLLQCAAAALERTAPDASSSGGGGSAEGSSSSVEGGKAEVAANLALASARLCSKRLQLSVDAQRQGAAAAPPQQLTAVPDSIRFGSLVPPDGAGLPAGGLAATQAQATALFNEGVRHIRAALTYYTLEGHVTMHCNAVLELSELYRWLADLEQDRERRCALHKARAKRVQELLAQLQPRAWPDIVRALQLDVANAYREVVELRFEDGKPRDKVAPTAAVAKRYYEAYVNAFRKGGKLPDSLESKEEEELYITAVFHLARVTSRLDPPVSSGNFQQTEHLRAAVDLYRYCAAFIQRNGLAGQRQLAATCTEMAGLITENVEMMRVAAARSRKG